MQDRETRGVLHTVSAVGLMSLKQPRIVTGALVGANEGAEGGRRSKELLRIFAVAPFMPARHQ